MFAALVPPGEVADALDAFLDARRDAAGPWRWTARENWHVTLAFFAAVPDPERLAEAMSEALLDCAAPMLAGAGAGVFPAMARAKVLFTGIQEVSADRLPALARRARSAGARTGAAPDGQAFRPHLTIARSSRPVAADRWVRALEGWVSPGWVAEEVVLVESHLGEGPGGQPRYEVCQRYRLRS